MKDAKVVSCLKKTLEFDVENANRHAIRVSAAWDSQPRLGPLSLTISKTDMLYHEIVHLQLDNIGLMTIIDNLHKVLKDRS